MTGNKVHVVHITFTTEAGVTIIRPVKVTGSRSRGEALARVTATAKAYIAPGSTVKAVTLP